MLIIDAFDKQFPTDDACKAYIVEKRWPTGVRCPRCTAKERWCERCRDQYHDGGAHADGHSPSRVDGGDEHDAADARREQRERGRRSRLERVQHRVHATSPGRL